LTGAAPNSDAHPGGRLRHASQVAPTVSGPGAPCRAVATVVLAVVAAHRTGQPLPPELVALGATFDRMALTAPVYRMIALPGPGVPRGGIVAGGGASVEVELHELPVAALGELLCALPAPLAVGRVALLDSSVLGMVCAATPPGSVDISAHRSWPRYLAAHFGN